MYQCTAALFLGVSGSNGSKPCGGEKGSDADIWEGMGGYGKSGLYKLFKNVILCKKMENRIFQVFHNEIAEKGGKISVFKVLSTFSTLNAANLGDYLGEEKERMFCEVIIKMSFCRKKTKNKLTFESSNSKKKLNRNVYTMIKNDYNGNTEEKRRHYDGTDF